MNMMTMVFIPAENLMAKLKFSLKILLIGALFLIPIAMQFSKVKDMFGSQIGAAEGEYAGVSFVKLLVDLQVKGISFRAFSHRYALGEKTLQDKATAAGAELVAAVDALAKQEDAMKAYELGGKYQDLKSLVDTQVKEVLSQDPDTIWKKNNDIVYMVIKMLEIATDASGLILDPEGQSFFLM